MKRTGKNMDKAWKEITGQRNGIKGVTKLF
jgi:hypothetical protein